VLILGLTSNSTLFFPPGKCWLDVSGMFEIADRCWSTMRITWKVAFTAGSSQQGNALVCKRKGDEMKIEESKISKMGYKAITTIKTGDIGGQKYAVKLQRLERLMM
jgi:hypothetical protein